MLLVRTQTLNRKQEAAVAISPVGRRDVAERGYYPKDCVLFAVTR